MRADPELPSAASAAHALASPKSSTFTLPSGVSFTFAGFRSRWTMPLLWPPPAPRPPARRSPTLRRPGSPPGESLAEVFSFDELERQERRAAGLLQPIDRGDVRVVQRGKQVGLTPEAREPLGIACHFGRQHLDRRLAIEVGVGRPVHLAHAAGADRRGDAVVRQRLSDHGAAVLGWRVSRVRGTRPSRARPPVRAERRAPAKKQDVNGASVVIRGLDAPGRLPTASLILVPGLYATGGATPRASVGATDAAEEDQECRCRRMRAWRAAPRAATIRPGRRTEWRRPPGARARAACAR